jgi:hypothetical protein
MKLGFWELQGGTSIFISEEVLARGRTYQITEITDKIYLLICLSSLLMIKMEHIIINPNTTHLC